MTVDSLGFRPGESSQNLAMIGYGLLFASIFFAGFPSLIAVVIAYSQRDAAPRFVRSHFQFQIRIFWVAFVLTLSAAACGLAGVITGLGEVIDVAAVRGLDHLETTRIELPALTINAQVIGLVVAALLLGFLSSLWLLAAPAVGFIRLASERTIGHSPRS
jgi:uncharacterized membrane protein